MSRSPKQRSTDSIHSESTPWRRSASSRWAISDVTGTHDAVVGDYVEGETGSLGAAQCREPEKTVRAYGTWEATAGSLPTRIISSRTIPCGTPPLMLT